MPKPGNKIHVPPPEKQALDLLTKVRPTDDMPRQASHRTKKSKPKPK